MKEFEVEINIDTKGAVNSIGELEDQISDLQERLKKEKIGSEEFKALSQELITAQKQLKNTELALEALDSEQVASELGSVTGAVGDVTAAFVLLGGEDGAVEETAQNIEKAIGISMAFKGAIEGVQSGLKLFNNIIKTSTLLQTANNKINVLAGTIMKAFGASVDTTSFAFKGLRTAIIATGIGALVVGIGLLIENFDKLSSAIRGTTKSQDAMNEASKLAVENIAEEVSAADRLRKILNDETSTRADKTKAVKELQEEYPDLLSNVDAEKDSIEDINKALLLNVKLVKLKAQQDAIAELRAEKFKDILNAQVDVQTDANIGITDHIQAMGAQIQSFFGVEKGIIGTGKAQDFANAKTLSSVIETQKQIDVLDELDGKLEQQIKSLIEEGAVLKENTDAGKEKEKQTKDLIKLLEKELQQVSNREATSKIEIAQRNDEVKAIQKKISKLRELSTAELESRKKIEKFAVMEIPRMQKRNAVEIDTKQQHEETKKKIETKAAQQTADEVIKNKARIQDYEEQVEQEEQQRIIDNQIRNQQKMMQQMDFTARTLGAIIDLTQSLAKDDEASQRKAFKTRKAAGIAQGIINTGLAVTAALTAGGNPIKLATGAQFAEAGIAALTGAAQVATIAKQKFESTDTTIPSVSNGGGIGGGVTDSQAPQFNIVGQSGFNQVAQALGQQQPVQAYVVAQDVTTAQQLNNNIISAATVGG